MKEEDTESVCSESSSQHYLRKRQRKHSSNSNKRTMGSNSSSSSRHAKPSAMIPFMVLVMCFATFAGSPADYIAFFRKNHRTLLTLTPEHVNQYPFSNFLEVDQHQPATQKKVVGFYWQIPRCGGTTLKHILGTCLRQAAAARTSADYCDMNTDTIQTCPTKVGTFVNADPSDHGGIQRCDRMGLIESGVPDVIVSSRILHAATLFDPAHKGRLFSIFRNPIERAVSTFFYLQNAYWERHYRPELKEMTILDYAALPDTANNWMTRWLTGKNAEPHLTEDDLIFAKELLRRKFLILLTDEMGESIERLLNYMNWKIPEEHFEETRQCLLANTKKGDGQNRNKHLMPEEGSPEYEALKAINNLDIQLFEYAQQLFKEQEEVIMKRKNKRTSELFIPDDMTDMDSSSLVSKASRSSEYEAAMAAAALMERPPDGKSMNSIEATNNLVASALMIKLNATTAHQQKDQSTMIASVMAKRQGSANKWEQFRGVAADKETFMARPGVESTQQQQQQQQQQQNQQVTTPAVEAVANTMQQQAVGANPLQTAAGTSVEPNAASANQVQSQIQPNQQVQKPEAQAIQQVAQPQVQANQQLVQQPQVQAAQQQQQQVVQPQVQQETSQTGQANHQPIISQQQLQHQLGAAPQQQTLQRPQQQQLTSLPQNQRIPLQQGQR